MKDSIVKIYNPNGAGWIGTKYEIDGKKIENVKAVDFRVAVDEVPQFTFETYGLPDIEMNGEVRFQFTPKTIEEEAKVICESFCPGTVYFEAAVASIKEKLHSSIPGNGEEFEQALAEGIARRIFGQEMEISKPKYE